MTLGQNCWSEDDGDGLTAGILMTGQRFSPYGEGLSMALADWDMRACGFNELTALELSEKEGARLMMDVGCRSGQQLGSVLEERVPFDLLLIMAGTIDLVTGVAPGMVLQNIQTLHAEGVRTVVLWHYAIALMMSALHTLEESSEGVDPTPSPSWCVRRTFGAVFERLLYYHVLGQLLSVS